MSPCPNCGADNTRDYPVCPTCATTCHFDKRADCRCHGCRIADVSDLRQVFEALEHRIRFLEERVAQLLGPRQLLTEDEVSGLIKFHIQTLRDWRKEQPPRIPFIVTEGGDIRYRTEEIERYLKSRERGKPALRAA